MPNDKPESNQNEPSASQPHAATDVDPKLLELLVCPLTKSTLIYDKSRKELISRAARLAYPIRDGIPIMLPEEARPLNDDEGHDR